MKTPEQKAIEKQMREQKRIARDEALRYRASQIITNYSKMIDGFRVLDPDSETILETITNLEPGLNNEIHLDIQDLPSNYEFSLGLELEKLLQYGMISNYILHTGGAIIQISSQGQDYFSNKKEAEARMNDIQTINESQSYNPNMQNHLDAMGNELDSLIERANKIQYLPLDQNKKRDITEWLDGVEIFNERFLKNHPLYDRLRSLLFHRTRTVFDDTLAALKAIKRDSSTITNTVDRINDINKDDVTLHKQYDVFISHANKDKNEYVDSLFETVKKLGINVFYDTDVLSWGDHFKQVILDGTANSEFAIIVISNNFFGREWTEKELNEFLNRQNNQSQKIVLPLLLGITLDDLNDHYPALGEIQCLFANKCSKEEVAILLAKELIKRYKSL